MKWKYIFTKKNTKRKNDYSKIINFENNKKKEEFIKENYFDENVFSIEKLPIVDWINDFPNKFNLSIDFQKFNNDDFKIKNSFELANKNYFVFLKINEENKIIQKLFYFANPLKINATNVDFELEIDAAFSFNINFKNNDFILNSHVNRFKDSSLKEWDFSKESYNSLSEKVGSHFNPIVPVSKKINYRYGNTIRKNLNGNLIDIYIDDENLTEEEKVQFERLNYYLSSLKWVYFYFNEKIDDDFSTTISGINFKIKSAGKTETPLIIICAPLDSIAVDNVEIGADEIYKNVWKSKYLLNVQISQESPFQNEVNVKDNSGSNWIWQELEENPGFFKIVGKTGEENFNQTVANIFFKKGEESDPLFYAFLKNEIDFNKLDLSSKIILEDFKPNPDNFGIGKFRKINSEAKLNHSDFKKIILKSSSNEGFEYRFEYLNKTEIDFTHGKTFTPEQTTIITKLNGGLYQEKSLSLNHINNAFGTFAKTSQNNTLPIINDNYANYISNWKSNKSLNLGLDIFKLTEQIGVTGLSFISGNLVTAGFSTANLLLNNPILSEYKKRKHLKASPTSINNSSANYQESMIKGIFSDELIIFKLTSRDQKIAEDHFYKFGSTIGAIEDINYYMNNRYYFNWIKLSNCYSNLQFLSEDKEIFLNNDIKNKIVQRFENGIEVWHYRKKENWNGINNYNYDNFEMDFINEEE